MEQTLRHILLPDLPPLRVLIVDDESSLRLMVRAGLEQLGYKVDEASSGLEGLNKLSMHPFDVLILDLKMPGMQGLEVMQHLPKLYPHLALIILTGRPTLESAIEAVQQKAVAYLRKPCSLHEIAAVLNEVRAQRMRDLHRQTLLAAIQEATSALQCLDQCEEGHPKDHILMPRFIRLGALILDQERQTLFYPTSGTESAALALTAYETTLLASLMRAPDLPHSCVELARALGYENTDESEAEALVRPHISRLRRKLSGIAAVALSIQTLRGKGYLLSIGKP